MFHTAYDQMVQFASEGELAEELRRARAEWVDRTGDLFESDETFERRIAAFLEWYVLDRPVSSATHMTPAKMYIDAVSPTLTTPEITDMRRLTRTVLSVFEYKGARPDSMRVVDLLNNRKLDVYERRKLPGLEGGDILEARLLPHDETYMFSDTICVFPRAARKAIQKATKRFRKLESEDGRLELIHRLVFLSNKCDRYAHLDPKDIFAEVAA